MPTVFDDEPGVSDDAQPVFLFRGRLSSRHMLEIHRVDEFTAELRIVESRHNNVVARETMTLPQDFTNPPSLTIAVQWRNRADEMMKEHGLR